MKKNLDFTEIKEFCDKVGLNCQIIDEGVIITKPKDIWDGVEFAECINDDFLKLSITKGKIYPLRDVDIKNCIGSTLFSGCIDRSKFKPSTESAYVEQLKKEAFERFGEIKKGDLFDRSALLDFKDTKSIGDCYGFEGFRYYKENDGLDFNGTCIYKQGNWATRVKERVKVEFFQDSLDEHNKIEEWGYVFKIHNYRYGCEKSIESGQFLSQQLEKYLNGEIE